MKIVFMGTILFSRTILEKLNQVYPVGLIVTQPDKKVGRKQILTPNEVKVFAVENQIKTFQPTSLYRDYQEIIDYKPDLIITAAYGQMIPKEVLALCPALNVHGSLLPKRRGGAPIQRAIMEGDEKTGITIMYMAQKMDSGDIIKQRSIAIEGDTTTTLFHKMAHLGSELLLEVVSEFISGTIRSFPQDESLVTFSYNLTKEDEYLDFNQTTQQIINHLNGLLDEPGGSIFINNTRIKIYELKKHDIISSAPPKTILSIDKELIIKTQDGALSILTLQEQGKRVMNVKDYLNGQRLFNKGEQIK
ncbi:MAG: methionyl-tRNA formyltransferase [Acholeplasmataceae bacterium]